MIHSNLSQGFASDIPILARRPAKQAERAVPPHHHGFQHRDGKIAVQHAFLR